MTDNQIQRILYVSINGVKLSKTAVYALIPLKENEKRRKEFFLIEL